MLITIRTNKADDVYKVLPKIKMSIFKRLMLYGYGSEDIQLSIFLKKNTGLTLRAAALYVYRNIIYNINQDNDIVITTVNKKADMLFRLINYGTMVSGKSNIFKYAFAKQ